MNLHLNPSPSTTYVARMPADKTAAATALMNAGIGKSNMDWNLLGLCESFCRGEAEFFGMPQTSERGRTALMTLISASGVDVERMEAHYFSLLD